MLKFFLWLKYLRKKKIVLLSIVAVALSVALLIVVASMFTGFIKAFEQSAVETLGDVVIAPPIKFAKYPLLIGQLEQIGGVGGVTAILSSQSLLHLGKGNVRAVNIWGIEPGRQAKVTGFKRSLLRQNQLAQEPSFEVAGFPDKIGGFVGIGVIAEPNEKTDEYDFDSIEKMIGQEVFITTGAVIEENRAGGSGKQFKRRTAKFTIADIAFTGVYDVDKSFIYLPIESLQKILYPNQDGHIADQIQIKLTGQVQEAAAMEKIREVWQKFAAEELGWVEYFIKQTTIVTAKEMQSQYVAELRKQMGVLLLIFGVISCSVVLLILCIFYMIVMTRQKDIAIIKSCGATNGSVAMLFLSFGGWVGLIGSGFGSILGYVITKNINTIEEWIRIVFGLKLWKSSVYMFSKIPNEVDWGAAMHIVFFAVIAAALGALIPAVVALRVRPVDILRYE